MRYIKSFDKLNESLLGNKLIPIFSNNPDWKLDDSWEGKNGDVNFVFTNGPFEVMAEFYDPEKTYKVSFRETGEQCMVPNDKRYSVDDLKDMKEVQKEMSKMMDFLEEYSK